MRRLAVAIPAVLVLLGGVAQAEETSAPAEAAATAPESASSPEDALRQAAEYMRVERCDLAIPLLEKARSLRNALWNMAECYAARDQPGQALEAYQAYLEHAGTQGRTRDQAAARAAIARLEPRVAKVEIRSTPDRAEVRVDGWELGKAPLTTHLGEGFRAVEVSLQGYRPWRQVIQVNPGENPQVEAQLEIMLNKLSVSSDPSGAEVSVDGGVVGTAPCEARVRGGDHVVEARLDGHRTTQVRATVPFGEDTSVDVRLEPALGTLAVATDVAEATLEVDGEARGASPFPPIDLSPGRHHLRVSASSAAAWAGDVDVLDARTSAVEVELASTTGVHQAWFWSTLSLTLAAMAGGAVLTWYGVQDAAAYELRVRDIQTGGEQVEDLAALQADGERILDAARVHLWPGVALLGVGTAGVIASIVLGLRTRFHHRESRADVRIEATQVAAPGGEGETP
jgi:hypothetical protein